MGNSFNPPVSKVRRPRPLERVEAEIVELSSQLAAATARLVALVGEFDAAEGWREWGMRSTAHWLSWQCGLGMRAAREQVRVAPALRELPATAAAFTTGQLSYSKVRAQPPRNPLGPGQVHLHPRRARPLGREHRALGARSQPGGRHLGRRLVRRHCCGCAETAAEPG